MAEIAHQGARILLRAPTGSGKSTGVPLMLLEEGRVEGRILVVQPRRIAARMLAEYVSRLAGSRVGESVGYAVRFDSKYGNKTRVIYLTDGVLQRWLREDPELKGVGAVIFDEFHERRLSSDLVLARTLDLQEGVRPDLKLMVMSATLETGGLADYLRREARGGLAGGLPRGWGANVSGRDRAARRAASSTRTWRATGVAADVGSCGRGMP